MEEKLRRKNDSVGGINAGETLVRKSTGGGCTVIQILEDTSRYGSKGYLFCFAGFMVPGRMMKKFFLTEEDSFIKVDVSYGEQNFVTKPYTLLVGVV